MSQECRACGGPLLGREGPRGVCQACIDQRRPVPRGEPDGYALSTHDSGSEASQEGRQPGSRVEFLCVSCNAELALPVPRRRTRVQCPGCEIEFHLTPDGRALALLEGAAQPFASGSVPDPGSDFDHVGELESSTLAELRTAAGLPEQLSSAADPTSSELGYRILSRSAPKEAPKRRPRERAARPGKGASVRRTTRRQSARARGRSGDSESVELSRGGRTALQVVVIGPLLVTALMLFSTQRERGFATRGELGSELEKLGRAVALGVRDLGDQLGLEDSRAK
jgi:hypothetical protein